MSEDIGNGRPKVAVVGAGPAGLMAAGDLAAAGFAVEVFDAMPSPARKLLLAGRGGLNLTHTEPRASFERRYEPSTPVAAWLDVFDAEALRNWAHGLGIETFVGSSGRVFPVGMKAAPLLRQWLIRLAEAGVVLHRRHRWQGWDESGALQFQTPAGPRSVQPRAVVLALGGGSWPRMGSDAAWVPLLREKGVEIAPLLASNAGVNLDWSDHFRQLHAGQPLKGIALSVQDPALAPAWRRGECMVTRHGLEGGLIYAHSARIRDALQQAGRAWIWLDLLPQRDAAWVAAEVARPRGARSWSSHLQSRLGLKGARMALLRESLGAEVYADPARLAAGIKALPLQIVSMRPLEEAISSAGGVRFSAVDTGGMLHALPGVFCAGEMLDWDAPTGGYLLTASMASGKVAAAGVRTWLAGLNDAV
ncbi:MAG: TIGR03862 family flavoprotein [Corticimicrobacter sp.]|uniref:TIGR03862 family flavoprotein n=1 Tax=Corticimicrobacter sp. TaxID=2678536 RepID=UPI0032DB6AB9